jgi:hypothetical protein
MSVSGEKLPQDVCAPERQWRPGLARTLAKRDLHHVHYAEARDAKTEA